MAQNNFKVSGTLYISKAGNDSLSGSTPDQPKKSLQVIPASPAVVVVGAGEYDAVNMGENNGGTMQADGRVRIVNPNPTGNFNIDARDAILIGFYFERVTINSVEFDVIASVSTCVFKNCTGGSAGVSNARARNYGSCIFINCSMGDTAGTASGRVSASSCIFINTTFGISNVGAVLQNCYIDPDSIVKIRQEVPVTSIRNNNIQGVIQLLLPGGWKSYAIQDNLVGTPQANGYAAGVDWLTEAQLTADGYTGTISGWNTAVASCMNKDPKFFSAENENFNLQADSPHIRAALDGVNNIGATKVGVAVLNTDDGNAAGTRVLPSAQIDTSIPLAYKLSGSNVQGFVDYVVKVGGKKILRLDVNTLYSFNSDIAGGTNPGNYNVPDSQPLTATYAKITTTTGAPGTLNQLIVPQNLIDVNDWIRVNGQPREVTSKTNAGGNDTLTLSSDLIAAVGLGVSVTYGSEAQLAALNPNRLTVQMRTRTSAVAPTVPLQNSDWDNEVDPSYGVVGVLFEQEINKKPGLIIDGDDVYGVGDSGAPTGIIPQDLAPQWAHMRVYLRNNYSSKGI